MAASSNSELIVEPLMFHCVHGAKIRISDNATRARRERLGSNIIFTNRPLMPNELVQFSIEAVETDYHGTARIGFTKINPANFTSETLPKSIPRADDRDWFIPTPPSSLNSRKTGIIRAKYTAEGDIFIDYTGQELIKCLSVPPISGDVWCVMDLTGNICEISLIQSQARVLSDPVQRARERFLQYTHNRTREGTSIFYSDELTPAGVYSSDCDTNSYLSYHIVARSHGNPASFIIDESLKRSTQMVFQILDMDHTKSDYCLVRCLINEKLSLQHTKLIDSSFDYLCNGDEIGIRVLPNGSVMFSCNNRRLHQLFQIDLTVNDDPQVRKTNYNIEIVLNARITGMRLIGVYRPNKSEENAIPTPAHNSCQATVIRSRCPNKQTGLLLPCRHLCVCHECGQEMINKCGCPIVECRRPVTGCVRVYKD